MEEIPCKSWEEFEEKVLIDLEQIENRKKKSFTNVSNLLFRGHSNARWRLETTLERFWKDRFENSRFFSIKEYHDKIRLAQIPQASFSREFFEPIGEYKEKSFPGPPSSYEFMVYLRHHGFPSPLLDWTKSPYIAAFFAFQKAFKESGECNKDQEEGERGECCKDPKESRVAIYTFWEYTEIGKIYRPNLPYIEGWGDTIRTHKRHHIQKCEYTVCLKQIPAEENEPKKYFDCHENVRYGEDQDILKKYTIPASERLKVMEKLYRMDINAFTLFGNEEGLMDKLAFREIELRENLP